MLERRPWVRGADWKDVGVGAAGSRPVRADGLPADVVQRIHVALNDVASLDEVLRRWKCAGGRWARSRQLRNGRLQEEGHVVVGAVRAADVIGSRGAGDVEVGAERAPRAAVRPDLVAGREIELFGVVAGRVGVAA